MMKCYGCGKKISFLCNYDTLLQEQKDTICNACYEKEKPIYGYLHDLIHGVNIHWFYMFDHIPFYDLRAYFHLLSAFLNKVLNEFHPEICLFHTSFDFYKNELEELSKICTGEVFIVTIF